ncbi:hypothetical protein B0H12DRAFT_733617 [Mycena haematopus]|nr:hypothetical protein B0H12DRAFT_733617 [Mycena haematopus]
MTQVCWKCGAPPKASLTLASLLEPLPPNPPPVIHLLNTNDAPIDSEIQVVQEIVSAGEDRMRALDAEIVHLQTTLAQLAERRIETTEHLREHRAILSAVRRVPQELICEIFDLSSAQDRADPEARPPWRLGGISRPWRQYALAYPPLWSFLVVPASKSHLYFWGESWTNRLLCKLETQLLRCSTAPLDIHWATVDVPDSRILDLILPHSNRWRTVSFSMAYSESVLDWLEPVRGKLDRLQNLEVADARRTTFPDVFTTAPNLRYVALPQVPVVNHFPLAYQASIPIPWEQITHYRGEHPFAQQLAILQAAPNLSNCALDIDEPYDFVPPTYTTVTLPRLRRLCLDWVGFLLPVEAPNLEELCSVHSMGLLTRIPLSFADPLALSKSSLCGNVASIPSS